MRSFILYLNNCEATIIVKSIKMEQVENSNLKVRVQLTRGPLKSEVKEVYLAAFAETPIDLSFTLKTQIYKVEGGTFQPKTANLKLFSSKEPTKVVAEAPIDLAKHVGDKEAPVDVILCAPSNSSQLEARCLLTVQKLQLPVPASQIISVN